MSLLIENEYMPGYSTGQNNLAYNLADDTLVDIVRYLGKSAHQLRCTCKVVNQRLDSIVDYFMKPCHKNLQPLDTHILTNTLLIMIPELFKPWGRYNSTLDREILFGEACRIGDISTVQHIMTFGVDIDGGLVRKNFSKNWDDTNTICPFSPVQDAVTFNQPEILKFLFRYGASMSVDVGGTGYFLDNGWSDLYDFVSPSLLNNNTPVPNPLTHDILSLITKEYMIRKDYSMFFRPGWRSNEQLFPWFCTALAAIPKGTESKYGAHCDNQLCRKWCNNVLICNGKMLCPSCADKPIREKLTLENCKRLLWVQPVVVISENMFDEWDDADQSFGSVDYPDLISEYDIDDDSSAQWDNDNDAVEAYGY